MKKTIKLKNLVIMALCFIAFSSACRYSLIRFDNLEEAVEYYNRAGKLQYTVYGKDTLLATYEIVPGGYGSVVLSEEDGTFRRVETFPTVANLNEYYQIRIYNFDFTEDRYIEVYLWKDDPSFEGLEISNAYGWDFHRAEYVEPGIYVSVAGFTAESGKYSIQINGQIVRFSLR